jgi:hypothetical protein
LPAEEISADTARRSDAVYIDAKLDFGLATGCAVTAAHPCLGPIAIFVLRDRWPICGGTAGVDQFLLQCCDLLD